MFDTISIRLTIKLIEISHLQKCILYLYCYFGRDFTPTPKILFQQEYFKLSIEVL